MNIFYLDTDLNKIAEYHCDQHAVKMVTETAQMLSTAHRILDGNTDVRLMKQTHVNHTCTKWIRQTSGNYEWGYMLFCKLSAEYTRRYGRTHRSFSRCQEILATPPDNIAVGEFTTPPQCMPDEYKDECTVQAYRNFYIYNKSSFARWTKLNNIPNWYVVGND